MHKAGFVNIIGKPNVGKSTLMNAMLGQELSIVTPKAQTTRHRIKGIVNGENYQLVLSDTPGIIKPVYKLHAKMMDAVNSVFTDADIIMLVLELGEKTVEEALVEKIKNTNVPLFVVVNKIDTGNQELLEESVERWKQLLSPTVILPVSALEKFNIDTLITALVEHLPESPPYFSKEDLTDRNERFFVTEIVREQILLNYQKEIPYSTEVTISGYREKEDITVIECIIFVARESQKGIIIGHKGEALKRTGTDARRKIEKMLDRKVFLSLTVKVNEGWRDSENQLKKFGYTD
jgi:GTP-binding protein Era